MAGARAIVERIRTFITDPSLAAALLASVAVSVPLYIWRQAIEYRHEEAIERIRIERLSAPANIVNCLFTM